MTRKRALLATLVAASAVLLTATGTALAQGPDRVPRVMALWDFGDQTPLTWDTVVAEGAVALVVTGKGDAFDSMPSALLYADVVKETIKHNLPDLTDEQVAELALPVEIALDHGNLIGIDQRVTFVKNGGVERPSVYFDRVSPPAGATAQAGPDGDVVVLGRFYFRQKMGSDEGWPWHLTDVADLTWLLIPPSHKNSSEAKMLLAIGWFTK